MLPQPSKRIRARILILACVGLAAALAVVGGLHLYNRSRFDLGGYEERMGHLIARAGKLAERAPEFDQEEALAALGTNPLNGPVYRFDERWREARLTVDEQGAPPATGSGDEAGVHFDFEGDDTHHFDPDHSSFEIDGGFLRTRHREGKSLRSIEPFEIPWDDAASVRFRMKLEKGQHVEFAFARGLIPERNRIWEPQIGLITVDVVPDGEFHTYEVNIRDAFEYNYGSLDLIQRLFFRPSNVEGDEVEIDFIHIIRRKARYLEHPAGTTYETFNLDARPVLYMATPLGLTYHVTVPPDSPTLRFGLAMLEEHDPVTFSVTLREDERDPRILFDKELEWADRWEDVEIDMAPWAGREITLELGAASENRNIAFWSNPVLSGEARRRFNVVLLLEDTLRADHLSVYGHERPTSPVKRKLAEEGVVFETAFSQATETRPSCPVLMTSLYPTSTGVYYFTNRLSDRFVTLAEVLRSQGFKTGAFIQNNQAGRIAGLHQGYSHFFERYDLSSGPHVVYNQRLDAWLDQHADSNFFLYLHILDPHDPYEPQPPFDAWSKEPSKEHPGEAQEGFELDRSRYDGEILANDAAFGEFIEDLKQRGVYEDTLIVFLSDHGEFFGEHDGLRFHIPPAYAQVLHVPLLLRYPGGLPQGRRVKTPVGLIDVMPTVLELAGIDTEPLLMAGDSLMPLIEGDRPTDMQRPVVTDDVRDMELGEPLGWGSVLFDAWHLVNSRRFLHEEGEIAEPGVVPQSWLMEVFDYGKDPEEKEHDAMIALDPVIKRRLQKSLHELQSTNVRIREGVTRGEESEASYDPETLKRLRDLGYIQ